MLLNTKDWTDGFYPCPVGFDLEGYQAKIDRICGTAREHSKVRVVWGAAEEELKAEQVGSLGTALGYKKVGRYLTRVKGIRNKVRIRRWIFEEWQPPEIINIDEHHIKMPGTSGLFIPPSFSDINHKGDWELMYVVGDHTECDKDVCNSLEYPCHGKYRVPNNSDLQLLMRITGAIQDNALNIDPFSPLSQNIREALAKKTANKLIADREAVQAEEDAYFEDKKSTRKKVSFS